MLPLRDRLPTRRPPLVNYALIAANVLAYLWQRSLVAVGAPPVEMVLEWGLVPVRLVESPLAESYTVLSSMFLHDPGSAMHLGGNMLFLWIFGDNVEDAMGSARYVGFYLLSGIAAALAQVLVDPGSPIPMVGASGAISGVLAAYGTLYPRSPITVLNPIPVLWFVFGLFLQLPAWLIILEYFVVNLLSGLAVGVGGGGVAFFAHLGGFAAGAILIRFFMIGRVALDYERWERFRSPPGGPWGESRPRRGAGPPGRRGPRAW